METKESSKALEPASLTDTVGKQQRPYFKMECVGLTPEVVL